jgi:hypothetical protein
MKVLNVVGNFKMIDYYLRGENKMMLYYDEWMDYHGKDC